MKKADFRIIFMGTPEFAVASLEKLVEEKFNVVGVVTSPDKKAGRGQKISQSAVKQYALDVNIPVLQPDKLKASDFVEKLRTLNADLFIVVAFRMLPEIVWNMPKHGTFNLHASLLPQYRGAAPINWAVINGEKQTGVSTFFLQQEIDTGKILFRESIDIEPNDTAGTVHDRLMSIGAALVTKTTEAIINKDYEETDQELLLEKNTQLKMAPKIFKDDCKINWSQNSLAIQNHIRGLSPYPTAWSFLTDDSGNEVSVKLFESGMELQTHSLEPGTIISDYKSFLKVATADGFINILTIQQSGKKRMDIKSFLSGFHDLQSYRFTK